MSKIGKVVVDAEEKGIPLEEALSQAATAINETKPVKSSDKTDIMKQDTNKDEPVILSRVDLSPKTEFDFFRAFINSNNLAIKKPDGSSYLKAEAWLYLAKLKGVIPSVDVTPHRDVSTGKLQYVDVVCHLVRESDRTEISKSAMMAAKSEKFLKDLDDYAVYGMAETRAITRAIRNVYGYVAKGAGYESTPAIEMGLEQDEQD